MRSSLLLLVVLAFIGAVRAEENPPPPSPSLSDAIVLGLVEGVTEFLPVSSTGHLIITNAVLGLDSDAPVAVPGGESVPLKQAADTYAVVIQAGAIMAVVILHWGRLLGILRGLLGRDPAGLRLLRNIVLACIPPAAAALAFKGFIKDHLFSVPTVALALVVGAILMLVVEHRRKRAEARTPEKTSADPDPANLSVRQSLFIGIAQCLALWPGMSRSMVTMVAGQLAGLRPARAAEFSFLVGLPLLTAAAAKDALDDGAAVVAAFGWSNVLVGMMVAAVSAAIAVKCFVGYLSRHGFAAFAWYRIALAAVLIVTLIA